jgi:hypothetical protein
MLPSRDMKHERVDTYVGQLDGWQRDAVVRLRELIHEAVPDIGEDWKWDTPVFVRGGNVCAIGVFQDHVKVNFFKGASLPDAAGLFNAGLDAKASRAIDLRDGDLETMDAGAFRALVREAAGA